MGLEGSNFPGTEQPTKTVLGGRSSIWRYRGWFVTLDKRRCSFTHELGHYLGLEHTFHNERGDFVGRCDLAHDGSIGDFCADTPIDWDWPLGVEQCVDGIKNCPGDSELVTQSENYMYYNEDSCRNMFSKDQRARMRACLYRIVPNWFQSKPGIHRNKP